MSSGNLTINPDKSVRRVVVTHRDKHPTASQSTADDVYERKKYELQANLNALGFDFALLSAGTREEFTFDNLDKPSRKIFEVVIYFLVETINKNVESKIKLNKPNAFAKKDAIEFRKTLFKILTIMREAHPQFCIPKVSATLLMSPGGADAIHLLHKVSNLAIFYAVGGYNDPGNLLPALLSKQLGKVQLNTCERMTFETLKKTNLCCISNEKMEAEMRDSYEILSQKLSELKNKKKELLAREKQLLNDFEVSNKTRSRVDFEISELRSTVQTFWKIVYDAVELTDPKFKILKGILRESRAAKPLTRDDLKVVVPSILLKKFQKEIIKEVGTSFIDSDKLNLSKVTTLCSFALEAVSERFEQMQFSNLKNRNPAIKEYLGIRLNEQQLLSGFRKKLQKHEAEMLTQISSLEESILRITPEDMLKEFDLAGFSQQDQHCESFMHTELKTSQFDRKLYFGETAEQGIKAATNLGALSQILSPSFEKKWKSPIENNSLPVPCSSKSIAGSNTISLLPKPTKKVLTAIAAKPIGTSIPVVAEATMPAQLRTRSKVPKPAGLSSKPAVLLSEDLLFTYEEDNSMTSDQDHKTLSQRSSQGSIECIELPNENGKHAGSKTCAEDKLADMIVDAVVDADSSCYKDEDHHSGLDIVNFSVVGTVEQLSDDAFVTRNKIQRTPETNQKSVDPKELLAETSSEMQLFSSKFGLKQKVQRDFDSGPSLNMKKQSSESLTESTSISATLDADVFSPVGSDAENLELDDMEETMNMINNCSLSSNSGLLPANSSPTRQHPDSNDNVSLIYFGTPPPVPQQQLHQAPTLNQTAANQSNLLLDTSVDDVNSMEYQQWLENNRKMAKQRRKTRVSWYKLMPE